MPTSSQPLVLLVDDDRDTRELYRLIFEMAGYAVADAGTIAGAIHLASVTPPLVAVCDWCLPDGSGLDLATALRADSPCTVLIAQTGVSFDRAELEQARARGFSTLLEKPILPDVLVRAVGDAIESDRDRAVKATALRAAAAAASLRSRPVPGATTADTAAQILGAASAECVAVTVLVADDDGRCVAATDSVRALIGYDESDVRALSMWDLACPSDAPAIRQQWRSLIDSGTQSGRYTLRHRDGTAITAQYFAVANVAPGLHVSALARAARPRPLPAAI
jgi:PAS domain S-box-containing protein